MLLIIGLACLGLAVFFLSELVTLPARQRGGSLRRASNWGRTARPVAEQRVDPLRDRTLQPLKEKLARFVLRLNPKSNVEEVSFRLLAAGVTRRISPTGFLSAKALLGVGGIVLGIALGAGAGGTLAVMFGLMLGAIGFIVPDFFLKQKTKSRREKIRGELPDALDLLAVSVEAGLGFDGAVVKVTENMHGPLSDEFSLALSEMRIGESRADALKKMADRVDSPEMSAFVRSIIQADQFGISLGRILRVQAADTRLRRQAAAEERAMKAPIKMLFPTVMFIFPAMFLVTLGPAFLNLSKVL